MLLNTGKDPGKERGGGHILPSFLPRERASDGLCVAQKPSHHDGRTDEGGSAVGGEAEFATTRVPSGRTKRDRGATVPWRRSIALRFCFYSAHYLKVCGACPPALLYARSRPSGAAHRPCERDRRTESTRTYAEANSSLGSLVGEILSGNFESQSIISSESPERLW